MYSQLINFKPPIKMARTVKKGRDAETGRFIPIQQALDNPRTTVIETIKVGPIKHRK